MAEKKGKTGTPFLPNLAPLIAAGINPKTGLPYKFGSACNNIHLKEDMRRLMSKVDEQDAINRYTWYNLPGDLTGRMIEEILYYKGQGMFFYIENIDKFLFLPYALNGTIDIYNRFTGVTPVPIGSTTTEDGKKQEGDSVRTSITTMIRKPIYKPLTQNPTYEDMTEKCVLLKDYSNYIDQIEIPRKLLNDPLINIMSDIIPFMDTAMQNSTGVVGMRVPDDDSQASVQLANNQTRLAALTGERYIPITGKIEFQELASGDTLKTADWMQILESLDNFRLSLYGIKNGGLFQKKAHMLEDEQALASGNVGLVMQDGLTLRQEFCNRVNSIWPLGIWCEVSETVAGIDKNMDGEISDEQDDQYPADMIESETEVQDVTE